MEPDNRKEVDECRVDQWVDRELAELTPGDWEPNFSRGLALLRKQHGNRSRRIRRWGWVLAIATATCVSLVAAPITRAYAQRCLSACVNQAAWFARLLPRGSSGASTVYIQAEDRRMAPEFALKDAKGKIVRLSEFHNRIVLLNFWATWCAPCRLEMPMLVNLQEAYGKTGVAVLGVSLDEEGWSAVGPYLATRKINYTVLLGDDRTSDLFGGLKAVPTTFIIDKLGRIAATHVGLCEKSEYEADIRAVLSE